jgi:hypothetical protein
VTQYQVASDGVRYQCGCRAIEDRRAGSSEGDKVYVQACPKHRQLLDWDTV